MSLAWQRINEARCNYRGHDRVQRRGRPYCRRCGRYLAKTPAVERG